MKTPKLVLSVLACSVVVGNYAQNIPTHAPYVELLPTKEISIAGDDKKTVYLDFYDYFESWELTGNRYRDMYSTAIISVCGPTWIRKAAGLSRGYVFRVHTATLLTVTV